jgi:hypothetical protein
LVGATQFDPAGAEALTGLAEEEPFGETQPPGAAGAPAVIDEPEGVDWRRASRRADGLPSTGRPLACSKLEIAEYVRGPATPSATPR